MCLVKSSFVEFISFLMRLKQSVVLWQGRGGIQNMALFGKIPSPYYGKNSSNKQREMTVSHYFKIWRSVNTENLKNFESCSPPGCVRDILPRRRVIECCIRWPGLHNPWTSTKLKWFVMKEKQPTSAKHVWDLSQDCWKSIPGEAGWENAKSVQSCQGKGWLFEESQI